MNIIQILMMPAKMATPGLLKIKVITSYIMSVTSPTKFCHMAQIILWMLSCDQSFVTLAFT